MSASSRSNRRKCNGEYRRAIEKNFRKRRSVAAEERWRRGSLKSRRSESLRIAEGTKHENIWIHQPSWFHPTSRTQPYSTIDWIRLKRKQRVGRLEEIPRENFTETENPVSVHSDTIWIGPFQLSHCNRPNSVAATVPTGKQYFVRSPRLPGSDLPRSPEA